MSSIIYIVIVMPMSALALKIWKVRGVTQYEQLSAIRTAIALLSYLSVGIRLEEMRLCTSTGVLFSI